MPYRLTCQFRQFGCRSLGDDGDQVELSTHQPDPTLPAAEQAVSTFTVSHACRQSALQSEDGDGGELFCAYGSAGCYLRPPAYILPTACVIVTQVRHFFCSENIFCIVFTRTTRHDLLEPLHM